MEAFKDEDIALRLNSNGGDPDAGMSMIAKFAEHPGKKIIKVEGKAHSMAAFFLAFADEVQALDVSTFIIHRAAFPRFFEEMESFKDSIQFANLKVTNQKLRASFEAKIDVPEFEKITGVTMDELFSMDDRIDVMLTAKQAKKVGLVNKVVKLDTKMTADITKRVEMAASSVGLDLTFIKKAAKVETDKNNTMNLEEFKADNLELFNSICTDAVTAERDRVGAWMAFNGVDPDAVKKGIDSGDSISETVRSEMAIKMNAATVVADLEEEGKESEEATPGTPAAEAKTQEEKDTAEFMKDVNSNLKIAAEKA